MSMLVKTGQLFMWSTIEIQEHKYRIGEDIKYDPVERKIVSEKKNYYDSLGKAGVADDPEALKDYLCNIYLTLMTRGIKGTYVYVCDDELRKYMSRFIIAK